MYFFSINDKHAFLNINEKRKGFSKDLLKKIIVECYNRDTITQDIIVDKDRIITFTKQFKYLRSFISFDSNNE